MLAGSATAADAQATLINSRSGIAGATLNWTTLFGAVPTTITNDAKATPVDGVTVMVNAANPAHVLNQEWGSWYGNFSPNDPVIYSEGGPIEFVFNEDIFAFGANIQSQNFGDFLASITIYDADDNQIGAFDKWGSSNNMNDGSAIFLGIGSDLGFRRIVMNTNTWGVAHNEAIFGEKVAEQGGPQQIVLTDDVPVTVNPEPGTVALLAAGMAVLGFGYRRRRSTV